MNPPIPGHALIGEGLTWPQYDHEGEVVGIAGGCRCGEKPEGFPNLSIYAMKRWHRQHKAELRQDGES